jgi:hypothetical protein
MPPPPKPPHLRQRRNKATTAANLPSSAESAGNDVPPMCDHPAGDWHPMVKEWWASVWRSPMASEYLDADKRGGLYQLLMLHQDFWSAESAKNRVEVAKEIRLQEVRFGLSPIDRRRLQWTVEQGEAAAERTETRREARKAPKARAVDPRRALKLA